MNFLQLVQFAHRQIGTGGEFVGTTPLDVTVPFGPLAELSASINDAYKDIQAEQNLWRFRTKQGTLPIPNGTRVMSKATIQSAIPLYERMLPFVGHGGGRYIRTYDSVIGSTPASYCYFYNYPSWRGFRDFNSSITPGQPQCHTIRPDEALELSPVSDTLGASQYVLAFDYLQTCDVLAGNTATPIFPSEWHEAIGWRGVQYWGRSRQNSGIYASAKTEYERCMNQLRRTELPGPLLPMSDYFE